jgi:hypothetical protein
MTRIDRSWSTSAPEAVSAINRVRPREAGRRQPFPRDCNDATADMHHQPVTQPIGIVLSPSPEMKRRESPVSEAGLDVESTKLLFPENPKKSERSAMKNPILITAALVVAALVVGAALTVAGRPGLPDSPA